MLTGENEKYSDYSLVVYTDGSANPNPGIIGASSNGYVYNREGSLDYSVDDNLFTDVGYLNISEYDGSQKLVFPSYIFEMRNSFSSTFTSNYAEVYALYSLLDFLIKNEYFYKSILVYSDSNYLVSCINERLEEWKVNGWKRTDGKTVSEQELWYSLSEKLDIIRDHNIEFTIKWVKGHSNCHGNNIANFGANIARIDSHRNQYDFFFQSVKGEDFFKNKISIHPLLCHNNLIINLANEKLSKSNIYFQYNTDLPDNLVGKLSRLSSYSIVILNNEVPVIENVKNILRRMRYYDSINFIKLDKLKNKKYYNRLMHFPYTSLITRKMSNTLVFMDNEVISPEINPPGLLLNALETYDVLLSLLGTNYDFKSEVDAYIDVTSYFYDVTEDKKQKVKYTLKSDFSVGQRNVLLNILLPNIDKKMSLPVSLGLDLPERNVLKRLEEYDPQIYFTCVFTSNQSFEYYFVITTKDSISIWCNKASSKVIF